ncbi:type II secretion system protein [Butyrivibrio fibrisolvens]|uniref:type II secretion system protein n=1 Tax=Butyrivibrio fibrisolvens TaxID=831 RepID=UPI0020BEF43C|nr:prepilin-type N-terminal cleavage/methylation domain-containing protein [Butyrivibrio fibrisolvens]
MIKFMRNYKNNTENNEEDNKGFSLVELIIVIAIMAILVAVLAPQFLQYVERSRNSTDATNATSIVSAVQTYVADPSYDISSWTKNSKGIVKVTSAGFSTDETGAAVITAALKAAGYGNTSDITCKSRTSWTEYSITFTLEADGSVDIQYGTGSDDFANYMAKGSVSTTKGE